MTKTSELTWDERRDLIIRIGQQYCTALKSVPRTGDESIDSEAFCDGLAEFHNAGFPVDIIPYLSETIEGYSDILPFLETLSEGFILGISYYQVYDEVPGTPESVRKGVEITAWHLISEACELFRSLDSQS